MPTFKFTSPEGKTYKVEGPEGATQEQAFEILQTQLGGGRATAQQATETDTARSARLKKENLQELGRDLKRRFVGDDPLKELGIGIGRLPAETANLIDMGLSIFGQAIGVGGDLGMRSVATMHGFDNRIAGLMGQKFRQDLSEPLTNPIQKIAGGIDSLMQKFGHAPYAEKAYEKSQIYQVMHKVGELVQQGGDKAEKATGGLLTSADVDTFTQILTLGMGARGLGTAQPKLDRLGRVSQKKLPVLTEAQRAAEAPKIETAPRTEPALDMELTTKRQEAKDARVKELVDARLSPTGERINTILGIKPQQEKAAAAKTQRADIKKAVADDPDLADYYAAKAEERVSNETRLAEERAVSERNAAAKFESEPAPKSEPPAYQTDRLPGTLLVGPKGQAAGSAADNMALRDPGTLAAMEQLFGENAASLSKLERTKQTFLLAEQLRKGREAQLPEASGAPRTGLREGKALEELRAGTSALDSAVAKVKEGRKFDLTAEERVALKSLESSYNKAGVEVPRGQRGAADYEAHADMVKFLQDLGFDDPKALAGRMLASVDEAKTAVQNNASGESTASLEAQGRLASEKVAGQTRLLVDRDGTVRPLVGVDAVDQVAKPGQVILQKGVGKDEWTTLSKGADVGGVGEARAKAAVASQRGIADPKDLVKLAAVAGGAVVGSQLTDDPLFGAITGAAFTAGGLVAASRSGRTAAKSGTLATADKLDYVLGLVSTRIKNISQALLHSARTLEHNVQEKTHQRLEALHPFAKELKKVKGPLAEELALALTTNDPVAIHTLLIKANNPALTKAWSAVTNTLHEMGKEGLDTGVIGTLRESYFPRLVKDVDGLLESFGTEVKTKLQKDLADANSRSLEKTGSPLSDFEQAVIINRGLESLGTQGRRKPGFSKQRQIVEVTKELLPHYAPPMEALHHYVVAGTKAFERARFFGRDLVKVPREGGGYTVDLQTSIGNKLLPELKSGKISFAQYEELRKILQSRFGPGEQNAWGVIQDARNYMNAGLLGNVVAAASQIGDLFFTAAIQGLRPTAEALVMQMTGRTKVNPVDFGLMNHLADEFTSTRKSAKVVNSVLKLGLFTAVDKLGKTTAMNASLQKMLQQTKTVGGMRALTDKWEPAFGSDFPALVQELRSGKVGEQTRLAIFSELSNMQPVSRLEMPQAYLDHPNGRILYMLKSYQLKQLDVLRNESYNKMKKGDVAGGLRDLTKVGLTFGVAGATTQWIQNWILGRDAEFESVDIAKNLLRTFGWSEYVLDKARKGDALQTYAGNLTPPYKMFDDLLNATGALDRSEAQLKRDRAKVVGYLPVLGRLYEAHELGGAEKWNEREARRKEKAQ